MKPCTNNTEEDQEQGTHNCQSRKTTVEDLGHADPNNDIYQDVSITEWHFS